MDSGVHGENSSSRNGNPAECIVTNIETVGEDLRKIVHSGGYFFVPPSVIDDLSLSVGSVPNEEAIEVLQHHTDIYLGYKKGLDLLANRGHSTVELSRKLRMKGFGPAAVEKIIRRLLSQGYLDDDAFAREYLEYVMRKKKYGTALLKLKLREKGIDRNRAERAVAAIPREYEADALQSCAESLMRGKAKTSAKLAQMLARRGFRTSEIFSYIEEIGFSPK